MNRYARGVLLAGLLWLGLAAAHADVAGYLAEVVAAHGGGTAPTAVHERGRTRSLRRGEGPVERWWQAPDQFRIDIRYAEGEELRLLRGAEAWQQGQLGSAPFRLALMLQAARVALPWRLQENAAKVSDRGTVKDASGATLRVLEWALPEGLSLVVEVDPTTRLLVRSRGILVLGGSTMEFATAYSGYKRLNGRLVATIEQHYAMGQFIGTTTLDEIEYPAALPATIFEATPIRSASAAY